MRLFSILIVTVLLLKIFDQKETYQSFDRDKMNMSNGFSEVRNFFREQVNRQHQEKIRKKEELMRKQEEEKRHKIINQHLMPLTRGNSFMRDFYAGRY